MHNQEPSAAQEVNLAMPALLTIALKTTQVPLDSPEASQAMDDFIDLVTDLSPTADTDAVRITFALARYSAAMIQQLCDGLRMDPNSLIQRFALAHNASVVGGDTDGSTEAEGQG